jgi:hypothetical protein
MKHHQNLSRTMDYELDASEADITDDFSMDTTANSEMEDVELSSCTESSRKNQLNIFCNQCSTEVTGFESFEKHMQNHLLGMDNRKISTTSSSPGKITVKHG